MKPNFRTAFVFLVVLAGALFGEDIVLVDGRYLQVKVLAHTESKLKVLILETGGEVWLPWSMLRPEDRQRLRVQAGYEDDEAAKQLFEEGVKIITNDGEETLGVPVEPIDLQSIPESFEIWSQGKKWPFKKQTVRAIEAAQVPALLAYSPQQLYERKLSELNPAEDDLEAQWDIAKYAMAIDYYEKAAEHLLKVRQIDSDYEPERVNNYLTRMEALAKDAARADAIKKAKEHAIYKRFDRAHKDLDEILTLSDLSPILKSKAQQVKEWVTKARWDHFMVVVRREYFGLLSNKVGKMSRDPKLKLKDAQKEIRSSLHKEIVADIASKHGLDPKGEVEKMWADRTVNIKYVSSYGAGSFVVQGKAKGAQERDQQLQQAIARSLAQQRSQGGRNNEQGSFTPEMMKLPKPPTPDEWWETLSDSASRADWMKAYYAENGKQLKVVGERRFDCARCGATGTIKIDGGQGETIVVTCPRCQGHKFDKGVAYQ